MRIGDDETVPYGPHALDKRSEIADFVRLDVRGQKPRAQVCRELGELAAVCVRVQEEERPLGIGRPVGVAVGLCVSACAYVLWYGIYLRSLAVGVSVREARGRS